MLVKDAKVIANISNGNSKMPGTTYAQDSFACHVGSKLAEIEGSICNKCYARKIQKLRPSVNVGWTRNLKSWRDHLEQGKIQEWIKACAFQIDRQAKKTGERFHRWFDSGDIDSLDQLIAVVAVAMATPEIKHWLPTREVAIVKTYLDRIGDFPANLCVRVSSPMIDGPRLRSFPNTSGVHSKGNEPSAGVCPAPNQGNNCGACRKCWDTSVTHVSYKRH